MTRAETGRPAPETQAAPEAALPYGRDRGEAPAPTEALVRDLLAWFDGRERDVPWRDEPDPYRIWVAEVMAQQTRLETVRPYYRAFLERFPDVEALAAAPLDEVLHVWQGLGYYARARHLHRAAGVVVERHGGCVPSTVEALRELPGVGAYTAGAIASLAFGRAEPAVDGNARRVLARLRDLEAPTATGLEETARALLDAAPGRPAAVNQALMDLGGALCTPRAPACGRCPVGRACLARARGTQDERPPRRGAGPAPHRRAAAALLTREGRTLFVKRPADGLLGGLWDLPATSPVAFDGHPAPIPEIRRDLAATLAQRLGITAEVGDPIETVHHAFSHFRLRLDVLAAEWRAGEPPAEAVWTRAGPGGVETLATPAYLRPVFPHLERLGPAPEPRQARA